MNYPVKGLGGAPRKGMGKSRYVAAQSVTDLYLVEGLGFRV